MRSVDGDDSLIPEAALQKATAAVHNWLICYTLPANYTLNRQYNESVAEANSESLARAAIEAVLSALITPEWGIFRKTDPAGATPIENMRFTTKEVAQQYLNYAFTNPNNWEVRGRVTGGWER